MPACIVAWCFVVFRDLWYWGEAEVNGVHRSPARGRGCRRHVCPRPRASVNGAVPHAGLQSVPMACRCVVTGDYPTAQTSHFITKYQTDLGAFMYFS